MCMVYYNFFILHSAKVYLGPFRTSMMDFFFYQNLRLQRLQLHRHDYVKASYDDPNMWSPIRKKYLQSKVKVLLSLNCPTFCLTSVPRVSWIYQRNYLKWKFVKM